MKCSRINSVSTEFSTTFDSECAEWCECVSVQLVFNDLQCKHLSVFVTDFLASLLRDTSWVEPNPLHWESSRNLEHCRVSIKIWCQYFLSFPDPVSVQLEYSFRRERERRERERNIQNMIQNACKAIRINFDFGIRFLRRGKSDPHL